MNLLNPTVALISQRRNANDACRERQARQREKVVAPAVPETAHSLAHKMGAPVALVQRLLDLEAREKLRDAIIADMQARLEKFGI